METTEHPFIVGPGELFWDYLPSEKRVGGAPFNFAYHASKIGVQACGISAVGFDLLGDEIINAINKMEINHIIDRVN